AARLGMDGDRSARSGCARGGGADIDDDGPADRKRLYDDPGAAPLARTDLERIPVPLAMPRRRRADRILAAWRTPIVTTRSAPRSAGTCPSASTSRTLAADAGRAIARASR